MKAIVVADGAAPTRPGLDATWPGWDDGLGFVVAADGGALTAEALGLRIDLLVGDMDSLDPASLERVRAGGSEIRVAATEKDESDTELALLAALERGARHVLVLGALGGVRFDHALANVGLLAMPLPPDATVELLDDRTRISSISAPDPSGGPVERLLPGRLGDTVSLIPLGGDAVGVTTHGLRFALRDDPLRAGPARGLSNVRERPDARLSVRRGFVVIVESPADPARVPPPATLAE